MDNTTFFFTVIFMKIYYQLSLWPNIKIGQMLEQLPLTNFTPDTEEICHLKETYAIYRLLTDILKIREKLKVREN